MRGLFCIKSRTDFFEIDPTSCRNARNPSSVGFSSARLPGSEVVPHIKLFLKVRSIFLPNPQCVH